MISAPSPSETPLVCFQYSTGVDSTDEDNAVVAVCRRGIPVNDALQIPRTPYSLQPLARDARLLRPLPWIRNATVEPWALLKSCLAGIAIFVLPLGYIYWLVRDRRWSWGRLLPLPVIVLLAFGSISWKQPLLAALSGLGQLPLVGFVAVIVHRLAYRQWQSLKWWLGGLFVASIIAAMLSFVSDDPAPDLAYSWAGWYLVGLTGAYQCGCAVILLIPPRLLWRAARGRNAEEPEDALARPVAPSRVVSIVAGIFFVFAGLQIAGILYSVVNTVDMMNQTGQPAEMAVLSLLQAFATIGTVLAILVAVLAIAAGFGVMRRRKWGRALTLVLGYSAIPFGLASCNIISAIAALPYSLAVLSLILIYNKQFSKECR